jgi:hypothetical protein
MKKKILYSVIKYLLAMLLGQHFYNNFTNDNVYQKISQMIMSLLVFISSRLDPPLISIYYLLFTI